MADAAHALIVHPGFQHTLQHTPESISFWDEACCDGLLTRIAGDLDARSLASLAAVSRRCRRIASAEPLWRELCIKDYNTPPQLPGGSSCSWRELYKFNREAMRWLLAQTAAEALRTLGIGASARRGHGLMLHNMPLNVGGAA